MRIIMEKKFKDKTNILWMHTLVLEKLNRISITNKRHEFIFISCSETAQKSITKFIV